MKLDWRETQRGHELAKIVGDTRAAEQYFISHAVKRAPRPSRVAGVLKELKLAGQELYQMLRRSK